MDLHPPECGMSYVFIHSEMSTWKGNWLASAPFFHTPHNVVPRNVMFVGLCSLHWLVGYISHKPCDLVMYVYIYIAPLYIYTQLHNLIYIDVHYMHIYIYIFIFTDLAIPNTEVAPSKCWPGQGRHFFIAPEKGRSTCEEHVRNDLGGSRLRSWVFFGCFFPARVILW